MPDLPWYRYFPADFDSATKTWTDEEVGVYIRLLNHQWLEGSLPADMDRLARIAPGVSGVWDVVGEKFKTSGHRMLNRRLERERERLADKQKAWQRAGKKGAVARWGGHSDRNGEANGNPNGETMAIQNTDTEEEKKKNTRPRARNCWELESFKIPGEVPQTPEVLAALQAWLDYRKAARIKPYKLSRWIGKAWRDCGQSVAGLIAGIEGSIAREYQGVFPDDKGKTRTTDGALTAAEKLERFGSIY